MKASIVLTGFILLVAGILLSIYSKTVITSYHCEGVYGCIPETAITVYPDAQAGLALLIVGVVCMAVGAMLVDW